MLKKMRYTRIVCALVHTARTQKEGDKKAVERRIFIRIYHCAIFCNMLFFHSFSLLFAFRIIIPPYCLYFKWILFFS